MLFRSAVASALSRGWLNWVLNVVLIVFFAYFYTSMVFAIGKPVLVVLTEQSSIKP